jgi:hypothetical protein
MSLQIFPAASVDASLTTYSASSDAGLAPATGVPYSARVGGKTYWANVEHVGCNYEAAVPNLPGAFVVGSTVAHVEERLNNLIDFFA